MTTAVKVILPDMAGVSGMYLFLRRVDTNALVNTGGDAITEAATGIFTASVAETLTGIGVLHGTIASDSTETNAVADGWLEDGGTLLLPEYPASGSGGETDWTSTERAQIRYRLGLDGTATAPTDPDTDPIVITPGTGDITTGWLVCLDNEGQPEADVKVYARIAELPTDETGFAHSAKTQEATSSDTGVVEFPMIKGASYAVWRGRSNASGIDPVLIPADAGSTYELPSIRAT